MAYTVKSGDTLSKLYGADWKNLSGYSGDPTKLQIGTQLNDLPGQSNQNITGDTLNGGDSSVIIPPKEEVPPPIIPPAPQPTEDPLAQARKDYLASVSAPTSTVDEYSKALNDPAFLAKEKQVADLTAQLNAINAGGQVENLKVENQGAAITAGGVSRSQTANIRETAIKALPVAAQLAAAQGNLATAQSHLDKLFEFKSADAKNQNDYKNKIAEIVYGFASDDQKTKIDASIRKENRDYEDQKQNRTDQATWAKNALDGGDASLAGQISALDEKSPTFKADLAKLQSQIKIDPTKALDLAIKQQQLKTAQKQYSLLGKLDPAEQAKATELEKTKLATTKGQVETLQDKRDSIDKILSNKSGSALGGRVGVGLLSRKPNTAWWNPIGWPASLIDQAVGGASFAGDVHQLTSQEFLDKLIDVKNQGATFGNLSDNEGTALKDAATKINNWELKDDKGNGIGIWNVDEKSFKEELLKIRGLADRAILRAKGTLVSASEQSMLDEVWSSQPTDPASWYNK